VKNVEFAMAFEKIFDFVNKIKITDDKYTAVT